jgi:hypothetical protein
MDRTVTRSATYTPFLLHCAVHRAPWRLIFVPVVILSMLAYVLRLIDRAKLNVDGGAIALGHPVGSSANRLVTTLLKEMKRRGTAIGVATMCIGGGQGGAVVVEQV